MRKSSKRYKFEIGDYVRLTSHRNIFRKGYVVRWTEEIFRVTDRLEKERKVYHLEDLKQEPIQRYYYGQELRRVERSSDTFIIVKVLRTRTRGSEKEYFVNWVGYPSRTTVGWIV